MLKIFLGIQHYVNPLHVYCRFVEMGCSKKKSMLICKCYEKSIFKCVDIVLKLSIFLCRKFGKCQDGILIITDKSCRMKE